MRIKSLLLSFILTVISIGMISGQTAPVDLQVSTVSPFKSPILIDEVTMIELIIRNNQGTIPTGEAIVQLSIPKIIKYVGTVSLTGLNSEYWRVKAQEGNTITITNTAPLIDGGGSLGYQVLIPVRGVVEGTMLMNVTSSLSLDATVGDIDGTNQSPNSAITVYRGPLPDYNITWVDVPVNGNVSTNDKMPPGTTYKDPVAHVGNPDGSMPVLNPDGSYTFVSPVPGTFVFDVPVCHVYDTEYCFNSELTIIVLDGTSNSNPPVAIDDFASMKGDDIDPDTITILVKKNDRPGNTGGTLGTPIIDNVGEHKPKHGNVGLDPFGEILYTPDPGFYGKDTFQYVICETPVNKCDTANVIVHVYPGVPPNTTLAVDDYKRTPKNVTLNVGIADGALNNDFDVEGDPQLVIPQVTTIPGKGTLDLKADGSYTFTPYLDYVGPVEFPYSIIDLPSAGTQATSKATIYILIEASPLPVKLISFIAKEETCGVALLRWQTASEFNVDKFVIEFSADGRRFETVKSIKAANKPEGFSYSTHVKQEELIGYYRLKIIDFDRSFEYSSISKIEFTCTEKGISLYPNPTFNHVNLTSLDGTETILIYDASGKLVGEQKAIWGENEVKMNHLESGVYHIHVKEAITGNTTSFKVIKI